MQQHIATSSQLRLKRVRRVVKTRMNNARVSTRRMRGQLNFLIENNNLCVGRDRKNRISDRETDYAATHDGKITRRHQRPN